MALVFLLLIGVRLFLLYFIFIFFTLKNINNSRIRILDEWKIRREKRARERKKHTRSSLTHYTHFIWTLNKYVEQQRSGSGKCVLNLFLLSRCNIGPSRKNFFCGLTKFSRLISVSANTRIYLTTVCSVVPLVTKNTI